MMKGRNLIILVGIPGWLYLIWLGGYYYTFFILSAIILGLQEFYELAEKKNATPLRFMGFAISVFIADYFHVQPEMTGFQFIGIFILIILIIFSWQLFRDTENPTENVALTIKGILYIPVMLGTAIAMRQFDQQMDTHITFALVTSVWACDSAAFVLGSLWGSSKIFPRVSPN
ncbi:MAG: phosphatidate cytidylyltransferase, partial [Candidatus Neomarinimicrobiota bacterium]|nr:phosphatidate cytidylyltransferase [Candidatus Neomarinimicrobiota bacterium]